MTLATDQKVTQQGLSATSTAMLALRDEVLLYWEQQVRDLVDGARDTPQPILINTLPAFFDNIAEALTLAYPRTDGTSNNTAMAAHGGERARMTRLRADQIIHEYQLFRDAIMLLPTGMAWCSARPSGVCWNCRSTARCASRYVNFLPPTKTTASGWQQRFRTTCAIRLA